MGDGTRISWTDATWSPSTGCNRVSPGCDNCYALNLAPRLKRLEQGRVDKAVRLGMPLPEHLKYQNDGDPSTSGPGFGLTLHPHALDQPLRWKEPRRIFVNSMSDLFHKDVPDEFIDRVFDVMSEAHWHTFQVLTKRPSRMLAYAAGRVVQRAEYAAKFDDCPTEPMRSSPAARWASTEPGRVIPDNVWLGTSIENDNYSFRANHLRSIPAATRFLSCEPLLGPLVRLDLTGIHWVIAGGESGPGWRPMNLDWVRRLRDDCFTAGIPFFMKQPAGPKAGRFDELPADLQIQQWPGDLACR